MPNGDGINDYLEVFSNCAINVVLIRIFDKWSGELYRIEGNQVEAYFWENLPPGVVMVQVTYEIDPAEDDPMGIQTTVSGGVLVTLRYCKLVIGFPWDGLPQMKGTTLHHKPRRQVPSISTPRDSHYPH